MDEQKNNIQNDEQQETKSKVNDPDLLVGPYKPIEGQPATVKCPRCGEEMPTTIDTCVCCGHYLKENEDKRRYVPMEEKKVKRIRWIVGIICVVAFIIYFVVKKS